MDATSNENPPPAKASGAGPAPVGDPLPDPLDTPPLTWTIALLSAIAVLVVADLFTDAREGTTPLHLATELLVVLGAASGAAALLRRLARARRARRVLAGELRTARADAERWRAEAQGALRGLGAALDQQFERWKLTEAEREIALLLLKGLSLKEIATVRGTSERTVRQQSLAVYRKSNLAGRAELSAFFLEDLLLPGPAASAPSPPTSL